VGRLTAHTPPDDAVALVAGDVRELRRGYVAGGATNGVMRGATLRRQSA